jgi:hypothetical protein
LDDFFRTRQNEPIHRVFLQDMAQSQVLSMDIVEPIRMIRHGGQDVPMFVVHWAVAGAASFSRSMEILGLLPPGSQMEELVTGVDEIDLLAELLTENAAKLDPGFVNKYARPGTPLAVSVLTAVPKLAEKEYYRLLSDYCSGCGTSGCQMMDCGRCKSVRYCSRECQRKQWKFHKSSCSQS